MKLEIRKFNFTSSEKVFIYLWTFYSFFYYIFNASEVRYSFNIGSLLSYITYITIIAQILAIVYLGKYSLKKFVIYLVAIAVIVLVELTNTDRTLPLYFLFIILAQEIDVYKLIRYDILLKIAVLCIIFGLCVFGIVDNYTTIINGSYKQSLGFAHPNTFTCYVLSILIEYLCVRFKKMKWYEWIVIAAVWYVAFRVGGGRASAYSFVVIYLMFLFASIVENVFYTKFVKILFTLITPAMATISFGMVYLYRRGNPIGYTVNALSTGRISSESRILNMYNINLFGHELSLVGSRSAQLTGGSSLILDNAFINCALKWGAIIFVCIIILYSCLFWKLLNNRRVDLALLSCFFIFVGFGETYMLNVFYNLSFLWIFGAKGIDLNESNPLQHLSSDGARIRLNSFIRGTLSS